MYTMDNLSSLLILIFVLRYYSLAHAVNEKIMTQPSMLRAGTLRDYQLVGFLTRVSSIFVMLSFIAEWLS